MTAFLGKSWFPGPFVDVTAAGGSFAGQARFSGCIAFTNWPRPDAERLLPGDLELATNTSPTPDLHPVVFVFGNQSDGSLIFGGLTVPLGIGYGEFALAVPFVKHRRGRYLHTFVPRMYSSFLPATWSGNTNYGLAKRTAEMRWQGPFFLLTAQDGGLLLHATVESNERWSPGSRCELQNFDAMRQVFSLPIVGRKETGVYVCSYFGWDFRQALVRLADSCISIDAPLVPGLAIRNCPDVPGGTFDVRGMIWRLTWPTACRF